MFWNNDNDNDKSLFIFEGLRPITYISIVMHNLSDASQLICKIPWKIVSNLPQFYDFKKKNLLTIRLKISRMTQM